MIAIDMPIPHMCHIGKKELCPLMDEGWNCKLQLDSERMRTLDEQFKHCPLIDLTQYEDDLK